VLGKISKINSWHAALIIVISGFAVYGRGLKNTFMGDDIPQIITNLPVHSISHVVIFFKGGTFYNGGGLAPLSGTYYRPLMTTAFSLLYTLFGARQFYFHLFQLMLVIGSSVLLYLFYRYTFKPALALFLSLIFLVHPIDSQVVYAIPNMQDALYVFFGLLGLYLLFRYKSVKSLWAVSLSLFLSLLSKESGVLFVAMAVLYLFWFNRKRLNSFIAYTAIPFAIWLILRVMAVGVNTPSHNSPVDTLSLGGRLMTTPSIMLFYLSKFVFPAKLASSYYWADPSFGLRTVLVPATIDLLIIVLIIYTALRLRKEGSKAIYRSFVFFGAWALLGILAVIQIIPLDATAFEPWFYFPMIGFLGMIGTVISVFGSRIRIDKRIVLTLAVVLLLILGTRSNLRAHDYSSAYLLASHDIIASPTDYNAYYEIASVLIIQNKYADAKPYVLRSIRLHPNYTNYYDYGRILGYEKQYVAAKAAYTKGLTYGDATQIYEELGELTLVSGTQKANQRFLNGAVSKFPNDPTLWMYLALFDQQHGNTGGAQAAITQANTIGTLPPGLYTNIMGNLSFPLGMSDLGVNMLEIPSGPGGSRPVGSLDL
jgi:tetratricopeptide (TPR) repeat protein